MAAVLLLVLTAVTLAPPFGEASATAVPAGEELIVTVEVAVDPSFGAGYVVVHVLGVNGRQETVPLGPSSSGAYGGTFRIVPANRAIVFEAGREGDFALSDTVSLVELGVDADLLRPSFTPQTDEPARRQWGWLALAAGAGLGLLGLAWVAWPRRSTAGYETGGPGAIGDEAD